MANIMQDIVTIVSKSAPLLGTALGSPLAGMALGLIAHLFGVNSNDQNAILSALQSPESAAKLQQLQNEHLEALEQIQATNYQTEVDDRKNARQREITLKDHVPTILSILFLISYVGIQLYIVMYPQSADDIISARLQDVLIMIISYYFGSSNPSITK